MSSLIKYEYIGTAAPAGVARHNDMPPIEIYRNNTTGQIFYRTVADFHERMTEVDSPFLAVPDWARGVCCEVCRSKMDFAELMEKGGMTMILCPDCGNKRCPKAQNHIYKCTGSNAVGQVGEVAE